MGLVTSLVIGMSAYSAFNTWRSGGAMARAGEKQQEAAESAAELHEWNAEVAELQAADAIARGAEEENRFRSGVRGIIGSQRAAMAAGNVDVGFGSALDVQADAAYLGELDAHAIRSNAAREAWGYNVEAFDANFRASITRQEGAAAAEAGRAARTTARIGAVGTVLGAGVSMVQARYGANSGRGTAAT
jgi:hypothetical protein